MTYMFDVKASDVDFNDLNNRPYGEVYSVTRPVTLSSYTGSVYAHEPLEICFKVFMKRSAVIEADIEDDVFASVFHERLGSYPGGGERMGEQARDIMELYEERASYGNYSRPPKAWQALREGKVKARVWFEWEFDACEVEIYTYNSHETVDIWYPEGWDELTCSGLAPVELTYEQLKDVETLDGMLWDAQILAERFLAEKIASLANAEQF